MHLNEVKYSALLAKTGATPPITLNELELLWLGDLGYTGTLNERYHQVFDAESVPDGSFNERYYAFLFGLGFTGTLNEMLYQFWAGGGDVGTNLYPNPELVGGSNIVADVFATMPTNHVATIFAANPADATYLGAGNPAYTFVGTGNSRFSIACNVNTATNRGVTLQGQREYRFSATVQSIGEAAVETRLINVAAPANGAFVTDGPLYIPDGTPQDVYIDFAIPAINASVQLRHGIGMFNAVLTVGATQQTSNLKLEEIGPMPLLFDEFTAVDNTLVINHVPNFGPQAYQFAVDTSPQIVGNAVFSAIAGRQICGYDVGQVNKKVSFNILGNGNIVVFRLRVDMGDVDQNHVYVSRAAGGALQIIRLQAGVATTLASVSIPFVAGEKLVITDDGNTITASINGSVPIVGATTFLNTLTTMGLQVNGTNTSIDNLLIRSL